MGISQTYINIIEHPTVDATINFIKKFKSSKSYWSVSYFILLFTLREAIAWKFGSAIKTFCEEQVIDSSFPTFWEVLGFVLDVGGSWELVALGTFVFVVLSLVRVAESEGTSVSVRENYLTLILLIFVGSISFYQNGEVKSIVEDTNRVLKELKQENNVTDYLIEDAKKKDLKYAQLEAKYAGLRKSIRDKAPNEKEIIDNANDILEERGIESAIFYLKFQLSYLKHVEEKREVPSETNTENVELEKETIKVVEDTEEEDNKTLSISRKSETKWIKPSNTTYTNNGGKVNSDGCQANWEDAKAICSQDRGSLPSIEILRKVVTDCGGTIDDYGNNRNNFNYQFCYKDKGFTSRWYWSKTVKNSSSAWFVLFEGGDGNWYLKTSTYYVLCVSGQ
jgi:hypothetical protein